MIDVDAVNAWSMGDPDGSVVVAIRNDGQWREHRVSHRDAVTLADMLRLLTRTTD